MDLKNERRAFLGEWDFIKSIFLTDNGYMEKSVEKLVEEGETVKKVSKKLFQKLSAEWERLLAQKIEKPKAKLWDFLIETKEYRILQNSHIQLEEDGVILYGDYYFEKIFLADKGDFINNIDSGKYGINALLPMESETITLQDLDNILYKKLKPDEVRLENVGETTISRFASQRKFIKFELGISYDQKMDDKERFEYLKLLNLLYQGGANIRYLRYPSTNRMQNDLISSPSSYHKIFTPIIREVMKEISLDKLSQLHELFWRFNFFEDKLENYALNELNCILDLAYTTSIQYAGELLVKRQDKLIRQLRLYRSNLKTASLNWSIFERFYIKSWLWIIENNFYLMNGLLGKEINTKPSCINFSKRKKFILEDMGDFIKKNGQEIAQFVFGRESVSDQEVNNIKRLTSVKKYTALAQMILTLRRKPLDTPFLLEELVAIIQVVIRYTNENIRIRDKGYKGGEKKKPKSLKPIVKGMIGRREEGQGQFLEMEGNKYFAILRDMIADQIMRNLGVPISTKRKVALRKQIYFTYLKEVRFIEGLSSENQASFIEEKSEIIRREIFKGIWFDESSATINFPSN
jgi:hypothetical protein